MFEQVQQYAIEILSISIGGISLGTIIGMAIYLIVSVRKYKSEINVTKEGIETAFQNVVLPKSIKLDVSNKIQKPIEDGLRTISDTLGIKIEDLQEGIKLLLLILSQFTHVQKLTDEQQEELKTYLSNLQNDEKEVQL